MKMYGFDEKELEYAGIWQECGDGLAAYWNRSVMETDFTGETVTVCGRSEGPVILRLDGAVVCREPLTGKRLLTTGPGTHTLELAANREAKLVFSGLELPEDQRLLPPPLRPYVHFIGDSITNACPGFSYTAGEEMGVLYSVQAYPGMSLRQGWGWYPVPEGKVRPGMEFMVDKLEGPLETDAYTRWAGAWTRRPDALVIFLGTNDYLDTPEDQAAGHIDLFADCYDRFLTRLSRTYDEPDIYLLQGLSDKHCRRAGIEAAFRKAAAHLPHVMLVPTDRWEIAISADGTHPSPEGYADLGRKLADYLRPRLF